MRNQEAMNEALSRATGGASLTNYPAIYAGFEAKGIPADAIEPRVNVFTYNAWRALGRQVRKGEHGVRVVTRIDRVKRDVDTGAETRFSFPKTTTVFHVSQTEPMAAGRAS